MSTATFRQPLGQSTRQAVVRTYGWRCHLCGRSINPRVTSGPMALNIDHVLPVSRGGCDHLANLMPSHERCNLAKGNRARRRVCNCDRTSSSDAGLAILLGLVILAMLTLSVGLVTSNPWILGVFVAMPWVVAGALYLLWWACAGNREDMPGLPWVCALSYWLTLGGAWNANEWSQHYTSAVLGWAVVVLAPLLVFIACAIWDGRRSQI